MAYAPLISIDNFANITDGVSITNTNTSPSLVRDHEGLLVETEIGEVPIAGARREYTLSSTLTTHSVTVEVDRDYQISCEGGNASTVVLSGAATGTLTNDGANRQAFDTAKTATTTTLTFTITGTLTSFQVQDVTGRSNTAPSELADGVNYYADTNGNSVSGNVVTEAAGTTISPVPQIQLQPARTNKVFPSNDLSDPRWVRSLDRSFVVDKTTLVAGTEAWYMGTRLDFSVVYLKSYVISAEVEDKGQRYVSIYPQTAVYSENYAIFDLQNGTITKNGPGANGPANIELISPGRYLVQLNITIERSSSMQLNFYLCPDGDSPANIFVGNNVDGILIENINFEEGQLPTPHIETTTAEVTREADVLETDLTGINPNEGLVFIGFTDYFDTTDTVNPKFSKFMTAGLGASFATRESLDGHLTTANISNTTSSGETSGGGVEIILAITYSKDGNFMHAGTSIDGGASFIWDSIVKAFTGFIIDEYLNIGSRISETMTVRGVAIYDGHPLDTEGLEDVKTWVETHATEIIANPSKSFSKANLGAGFRLVDMSGALLRKYGDTSALILQKLT